MVTVTLSGVLLFSFPALTAAEAVTPEAAPAEFSLDEYVVTASRMPVKLSATAANVTVVTADQITRGGFTGVAEILAQTNVSVDNMGAGAAGVSAVTINGDDRVLILVDGRKINREYFIGMGKTRVNLNQLPSVKNIERIEIVRGPASALYGSDAAGGVINIITRQAAEGGTSLSLQGGSWGRRDYTLTTEGKENGFGYRITAERKRQDDFEYKDSKTGKVVTMPNSYIDQDAVTMRLDQDLGDNRSLSFYWEHLDSKGGYGLMPPGYGQHHPTAYEKTLENNVDVTYRWGQGSADNMVKVYHNSANYDIHGASDVNQPDKFLSSRTTGAEWQQKWQLSERYALLGGLEYRKVTVDAPTDGIYDKDLSNQAMYIENRWQLPSDWTVTAGWRYDDHNVFGSKATGRVTANRELNANTNMYVSWGQMFKAPNADELYGQSQAIGNPNLQPETGDTVTVGVNTRLSADTMLKASIFSSHIDNAISYYPLDSTYMYWSFANLQEQKRRGLDISLSKKLAPYWNVTAGYAYVQVKNKDQGGVDYYLDPKNRQPNGYRLNVEYEREKWDAGLALRSATGRSTAAYTSSSYWVMDLSTNYLIRDNLRAYAKVYNLTNRAYEVVSEAGTQGAFPMAARHFYFGVEQRL